MPKLLHISTMLGGGLGAVIPNLLDNLDCEQTLVCLDKIINIPSNIEIPIHTDMINYIDELLKMIKEADVVLLHMYNHPLIYKFLLENKLPECRLLVWYHNLGIYAPYIINKDIIDMSDIFVTTSLASFESNAIKEYENKSKIKSIWSTVDIKDFLDITPQTHFGFNIGYVGTLDYSKLHSNFVKMCSQIEDETTQFILCGGMSEQLQQDINSCNDPSMFDIQGKLNNKEIKEQLSLFDIFGYPLTFNHFGTCEQVLGEALAAGIPVVVMNNLPEAFIIKHTYNGLVASKEEEYIEYVKLLRDNAELRKQLSINARESAKEIYSTEKMIKAWQETINEVMLLSKTEKSLVHTPRKMRGLECFAKSCGIYENIIMNYQWSTFTDLMLSSDQWDSESKASARQYLKYFPEDEDLQKIVIILNNIKDRRK